MRGISYVLDQRDPQGTNTTQTRISLAPLNSALLPRLGLLVISLKRLQQQGKSKDDSLFEYIRIWNSRVRLLGLLLLNSKVRKRRGY